MLGYGPGLLKEETAQETLCFTVFRAPLDFAANFGAHFAADFVVHFGASCKGVARGPRGGRRGFTQAANHLIEMFSKWSLFVY